MKYEILLSLHLVNLKGDSIEATPEAIQDEVESILTNCRLDLVRNSRFVSVEVDSVEAVEQAAKEANPAAEAAGVPVAMDRPWLEPSDYFDPCG